ncbi:hypothetical protein BK120_33685 [Paenibacillus sp. FSL A5-0031]|uniref:hypothetical protein n=1 Tax=Paenibacillus sp. FSL A5-0031 TaxID=1920420 RepID=UPI00096E2ED8|nr:hypothetical protein [Paenibacillus sp. FSL A5-0031]OME70109.1 hypothetical protein BK120_33685 [Paenibacillus sp. FSL A5-0031]
MSIRNRADKPFIKSISLSELLNTRRDYTSLSKREAIDLIRPLVVMSKLKKSRDQFEELIKARVEESNVCINEMTTKETIGYLTSEIWNN